MPQTATLESPEQAIHRRSILTVRQLAERHPAFTESGLRNYIFKLSRDRSAVPRGDAFEAALRRVGRRVLIDEEKFLEWIDACNQGTKSVSLLKQKQDSEGASV
jgi:hypothetical protein